MYLQCHIKILSLTVPNYNFCTKIIIVATVDLNVKQKACKLLFAIFAENFGGWAFLFPLFLKSVCQTLWQWVCFPPLKEHGDAGRVQWRSYYWAASTNHGSGERAVVGGQCEWSGDYKAKERLVGRPTIFITQLLLVALYCPLKLYAFLDEEPSEQNSTWKEREREREIWKS